MVKSEIQKIFLCEYDKCGFRSTLNLLLSEGIFDDKSKIYINLYISYSVINTKYSYNYSLYLVKINLCDTMTY